MFPFKYAYKIGRINSNLSPEACIWNHFCMQGDARSTMIWEIGIWDWLGDVAALGPTMIPLDATS